MTTTSETLPRAVPEAAVADTAYAEASGSAIEYVDYHPSLFETLRETWHSRHLMWQIGSSAFAAYFSKYRLGPFWLFLQTFMSLIGYSLIFGGGVFNIKAPNGMPYFLFTMVGMMGWTLFQATLMISARSFQRLKSLVRDIHVPLIIVPIAGSAQALMRFFLFLVGYIIFVIYFWLHDGKLYAQLNPKFLALSVLGLFLCVTLAWGISFWTAPIMIHTRDVRFILRYLTPFWMFVTPVLYPIDHLHGKTRLVAELNPLSSPVEMAKVGLLGAGSVRLYAAIWSIASISLVFASGVWFMNRFGARLVGLRQPADDDEEDDEMMML